MSKKNETDQNKPLKRAWSALASMRLFCILAFFIALWFAVALGLYPKYFALFQEMDRSVLLRWLFSGNLFGDPVRIWLMGLVAVIFLLGLNLGACVLDDFAGLLRLSSKNGAARAKLSKLSILIVHLSYIVILSGHLTTAISGYRISVPLAQGKMISAGPADFKIRCEEASVFAGKKKGQLKAVATLTFDPNGENEKTVALQQGKTFWRNGVMVDLEANMNKPAGAGKAAAKQAVSIPSVRLTKNHGLYLDALGGILFFIGIVVRMIFRND